MEIPTPIATKNPDTGEMEAVVPSLIIPGCGSGKEEVFFGVRAEAIVAKNVTEVANDCFEIDLKNRAATMAKKQCTGNSTTVQIFEGPADRPLCCPSPPTSSKVAGLVTWQYLPTGSNSKVKKKSFTKCVLFDPATEKTSNPTATNPKGRNMPTPIKDIYAKDRVKALRQLSLYIGVKVKECGCQKNENPAFEFQSKCPKAKQQGGGGTTNQQGGAGGGGGAAPARPNRELEGKETTSLWRPFRGMKDARARVLQDAKAAPKSDGQRRTKGPAKVEFHSRHVQLLTQDDFHECVLVMFSQFLVMSTRSC